MTDPKQDGAPDAPETPTSPAAEGTQTQEPKHGDWFNSLPPDAQAEITRLRQSEAETRVKAREAEKQRKAEEAAQQQREQAALAEQGKFKELADARQAALDKVSAEIEALRPRAERVEALEAFLLKSVETRTAQVPDQFRALVPKFGDPLQTLEWLDANAALLATPPAPNLNPGVQGDKKPVLDLSDATRSIASKMGVDPAKVAKMAAQAERRT